MARVPFSIVPDVPIPSAPPEDYQRIQSSPAQFGGLIGQAEQRAGPQLEQAGAQWTNRWNEVAGDEAVNQFIDRADKLTNGDPTNPDPTKRVGLMQLKGKDALTAAPQVAGQLQNLRQQIYDNLQNGAQQLAFDQATRRYMEFRQGAVSAHLDQQGNVYAQGVNEGIINTAATVASNHFMDDAAIKSGIQDARVGAVKAAQIQYGDTAGPEVTAAATAKADRIVIQSAVERALATDSSGQSHPDRAAQILQRFGQFLDAPTAEVLSRAVRATHDAVGLNTDVQGYLSGAPPAESDQGPISPSRIAMAIRGQEGSGPTAVSVNGAVGSWQLTPGFFNTYARSGENFNNETDRTMVALRGITQLWNQYHDAGRVAVAYFSGPANVAPPGSPTPWISDSRDGNGTPTSAYVRGFEARLGIGGDALPPVASPGAIVHNPAGVDRLSQLYLGAPAEAARKYPSDPVMQEKFIQATRQNINELMMLQNRDEAERQKQKRDMEETTGLQILTTLRKDPGNFNPAVIWDPNNGMDLEARQKLAEMANWQLTQLGVDATAHGAGYAKVFAGIVADPSAPGAIRSMKDIWAQAGQGGDLTLRDADTLSQIFAKVHRDPDEATLRTRESSMMTYAKRRLTFPEVEVAPGFQVVDRVGEDIFNAQFVQAYTQDVDKAVATGKPDEINKVLSKDYVDKLTASMRSQRDINEARLSATGLAPTETAPEKAGMPIPPAPQGLNAGEWSKIMTLPPTAKSGQPYSHQAWAIALQRLTSNPDMYLKDFDAKFGPAGYDGAEILRRLTTGTPEQHAEALRAVREGHRQEAALPTPTRITHGPRFGETEGATAPEGNIP